MAPMREPGRPGSGKTDATGKFAISTFKMNDGAVEGEEKVTVVMAVEVPPMPGTPGAPVYAGFWIRFAAYIIDGFVLFGLLILCLVPAGLNLVAAAIHRYPYGGHVRIVMHLGPIVCLLMVKFAFEVSLNRAFPVLAIRIR